MTPTRIDPAYRFRTVAEIVATRPLGDGYDHDLVVSFDLLVKTLRQVNPASHAYGHPMFEFMDRQSGRHFYVTIGAYGTPQPQDFVARHAVTGNVIVSTFFRDAPRFGRRLAGQWIACGACVPETSFKFAINRAEFAQVLALARTLEPALSADPVDYRLANFRFQNGPTATWIAAWRRQHHARDLRTVATLRPGLFRGRRIEIATANARPPGSRRRRHVVAGASITETA